MSTSTTIIRTQSSREAPDTSLNWFGKLQQELVVRDVGAIHRFPIIGKRMSCATTSPLEITKDSLLRMCCPELRHRITRR